MRVCFWVVVRFLHFVCSSDAKANESDRKNVAKNWQLTLYDVFFSNQFSVTIWLLCFRVGRRNTKLRNESVISLYIWVAEPASLLPGPGVSLSFYFKLRSLRSYLCSAFLSITNLINKIANKNRIINTKFSRRTWQNNACQLLLCTQYMLPFSTLSSGLSGQ